MTFSRYFVCLFFLLVTACTSVPRLAKEYKPDIQQGNVLTQEMVAQLRPGLTRDQVRFALGTPMLMDIYHANRWDYVYRLQKGTGELEMRRFSVFFDADNKLTRVTGDVTAATPEDKNAANTAPVLREIDLGTIGEDTPLPPASEKGFFGRMWESVF